jgi:DNA-directed RNA polymerase specialized sigma24 family protein
VDGRELQEEVVAFTVSFEPYVPALVDDILATQQEALADFPAAHDDAQALAAARDATAVGVATALSVIRVPDEFPAALPAASVRTVRRAVSRQVSLNDQHHAYRVAHAVFQDHVFRHAERTGTSMAALRRITESLFAYYDWAMSAVTQQHEREQASVPPRGDPARYPRIERALAGAPPDDLGYDLEQTHVAVVLAAADGVEVVERAGSELGVPVLCAASPNGQIVAWLGAGAVTPDAIAEALARHIGDGRAGVSEREAGAHGFAGAHRKALIALRVGARRDSRVCVYRDVALEALAFGGEEIAIDFARAELGRMAGGGNRITMLRETVQQYFAHGSSTAATARALGIAERTVTYRLRRAEELIGRPLAERRADLETALRLYAVLDLG